MLVVDEWDELWTCRLLWCLICIDLCVWHNMWILYQTLSLSVKWLVHPDIDIDIGRVWASSFGVCAPWVCLNETKTEKKLRVMQVTNSNLWCSLFHPSSSLPFSLPPFSPLRSPIGHCRKGLVFFSYSSSSRYLPLKFCTVSPRGLWHPSRIIIRREVALPAGET